jgi:hypothetical protein
VKESKVLLFTLVLFLAAASGAWALTATGSSGTFMVANENGRFYNGGAINTDPTFNTFNYIPGGTNQLKINTSATSGQAPEIMETAISGSYSNSNNNNNGLWLTTNGGKGGNDDMILGVAVTGTIYSNFSLTIQSNGYVATPVAGNYQTNRPVVTAANWVNGQLNETFNNSDFIYGPQSTRPEGQALYPGQNPATTGMMMFIDLGVCNRTGNMSDQVIFSVSGLYAGDILAFSSYGYDLGSAAPDAVKWTNPTGNDYIVTGAGAPVPIPGALLLFGPGLAGLAFVKRRFIK